MSSTAPRAGSIGSDSGSRPFRAGCSLVSRVRLEIERPLLAREAPDISPDTRHSARRTQLCGQRMSLEPVPAPVNVCFGAV
jgi:hypothetical protein